MKYSSYDKFGIKVKGSVDIKERESVRVNIIVNANVRVRVDLLVRVQENEDGERVLVSLIKYRNEDESEWK